MEPHILHEDGTICHHEGLPKVSSISTGISCSEGIIVTHVRFSGNMMTIEEAGIAFTIMAQKMNEVIFPLMTAFMKIVSAFGQAVISARTLGEGEGENPDAIHDQATRRRT
jgi:hypothetical protein